MIALIVVLALAQSDLENKFDSLLPRLKSDNPAERDAASRAFKESAQKDLPGARTFIRARIQAEGDPEVRARLQAALAALPVFELKLTVEGEARVGCPVKFAARIKNISDGKQHVVRCMDGSSYARRFPHYVTETVSPTGKKENSSEGMPLCGSFNALGVDDVIELQPGEAMDPYTSGAVSPFLEGWTPEEPGKFTLKLTCKFDAPGSSEDDPEPSLPRVRTLVSRVPQTQFSASIELEVKP